MTKKYDAVQIDVGRVPFKFGVRSRLGNHLIAKTKTRKMAERIAKALESDDKEA